MSRSVHANRSRRILEQRGYLEWAEIDKKRRIKRGTRCDRVSHAQANLSSVRAAAIPISEGLGHPRLWFPASREDIRSVLGLVPPGTLQGLSSVHLESGTLYVNHHGTGERDPFLCRKSEEFTPGVWIPAIRGTYSPDTMAICLFGYVVAPDVSLSSEHTLELRFKMLRTLVHELAHHDDRTRRVARGRWRMDDEQKAEWYADIVTRRWCSEIVVPYLRASG